MDNGPDMPPGTIPAEKQYSDERLAEIKAALIEELGIGRKDSLPLQDRGAPIETLRPLQVPRKNISKAIAAWHTLHLEEGTDSTNSELDNIADGQLYRLRRGARTSGPRGNSAPRGGHFSHGHRGGSRGNNGVHSGHGGHNGRGVMGPGRQDDRRRVSSFTPSSLIDDATAGSTHLDAVQDRLRGPAVSVNLLPERQSGHRPSATPSQNRQSKARANAPPSKPSNSKSARPAFKLDDSDGFLKWAGIGNSATAQPSATPKPAVSEDLQPSHSTLTRSSSNHSTPAPSITRVASPAQTGPPTNSLGSQGLFGSKLGPSPPQHIPSQAPSAQQQLLQPQDVPELQQSLSSPSIDLAFAGHIVLRLNNVKIKKNDSPAEKDGIAAMTKKIETDDLLTLVLFDPLTGNFWVDEAVSHDAVFEVLGCTVTYQAVQQANQKPPTWKIKFQLPLYANSFMNFITLCRSKAGYVTRVASDMGYPPSNSSASLNKTASYSAPETVDTSSTQQENTEKSNESVQNPLNIPHNQHHAGYGIGNDLAPGTFAQVAAPEHIEPLITFGDDVETYNHSSNMNPDFFDLLEAMDGLNLVENLYAALGGDSDFFDHMSQEAVVHGGKPVSEVSSDELTSDPVYESVLETAVARYLLTLESFALLSTDYSAEFIKYQSHQIMDFAIPRRSMALDLNTDVAIDDTTGYRLVDDKTTTAPKGPNIEHTEEGQYQALSRSAESSADNNHAEQSNIAENDRIKYSPNHLLRLRYLAVDVEINEKPPRDRHPTNVAPPTTTVNEWQTFGAAESMSTAPVTEIPSVSALTAPVELQDVAPATSQVTAIPTAISRQSSETAPDVSTVNQWQAFAAKEQLKVVSEVPATPNATPNETLVRVASSAAAMNTWRVSAAADESKSSAEDNYIPITAATGSEMRKPLDQGNPALKPAVSATGADSTKPGTMNSPLSSQRTDDPLWAAMAGSVRSPQILIKSEPQISRGTLRHHPSKSDINERLAKSFSGLDLSTIVCASAVEPTTPIAKSMMNQQVESIAQPTPTSTLRPRDEVSSSAVSTPAMQTMKDKIAASSKQTLLLSPSQSPNSSFAQQPAFGDSVYAPKTQMKTEVEVKLEPIDSPKVTFVKSEPGTKTPLTRGIASSPAVTDAKTLDIFSSPQMVAAETPVSFQKIELGGPLHTAVQPANSVQALDENFNKVLKGASGLASSKWAEDSNTPEFTGRSRLPQSSFQPNAQGNASFGQGPHANQVPTSGAPVFATILVRNEDGSYSEVTGMVKFGSIPIVADAPIPQRGHLPQVENVRPSSGHTDYSNYPTISTSSVRSSTKNHSLFGSVHSESKINPVAATFRPSPHRPQAYAPVDQRPALSPRRGNLQSQLQSRLNSSMTSPRATYQDPQL